MGKKSGKHCRIDKTMSESPQLQGLRPFKVNLKNVKIERERCKKIRIFLERQSNKLGRSVGDILSQSLTLREVSKHNSSQGFYIHVKKDRG